MYYPPQKGNGKKEKGKSGRAPKYRNVKTEIDGITFDSRLEAHRWVYLRLLEKKGTVRNIRRQVEFVLVPEYSIDIPRYGKKGQALAPKRKVVEKAVKYKADFVYEYMDEFFGDWTEVIEDTKGVETKEYIIKRKLMRHLGHPIVQVKSASQTINLHEL